MLRPLDDYIVVKPLEREHSKVIAVISNEKNCRGEVLAVGPGKPNKKGHVMPLDVRVGEIVAFGNGDFDFYPKHYEMAPDGVSHCYRVIQEADIAYVEMADAA